MQMTLVPFDPFHCAFWTMNDNNGKALAIKKKQQDAARAKFMMDDDCSSDDDKNSLIDKNKKSVTSHAKVEQ